jgi:hypothetical protein
MKEFFTKSTVEAQCWCNRCGKQTIHRIDNGRKGACLTCMDRLEKMHAQLSLLKPLETEEQLELFK